MEEHDMPFSLQMGSIFLHAFTTRPSWFTIPRLVKKIPKYFTDDAAALSFTHWNCTIYYDSITTWLERPRIFSTGIVTFGMDMWLYFNANFFIDIWDNLSYVFSTYWYVWLELYLACLWNSWNILPHIPPQLFHQFLSHFATPSCWGFRKIMRSLKTT